MEDLGLMEPLTTCERDIHKNYVGLPMCYNLHEGLPFLPIIFIGNDVASSPHEDPIVITFQVRSCKICKILAKYWELKRPPLPYDHTSIRGRR